MHNCAPRKIDLLWYISTCPVGGRRVWDSMTGLSRLGLGPLAGLGVALDSRLEESLYIVFVLQRWYFKP